MFWSARENLGGLKHWQSRLSRVILGRARTSLVDKYKASPVGKDVDCVCDADGSVLFCRFCGYALMSVPLGSTTLTVCSAAAQDGDLLARRETIAAWASSLPELSENSLPSGAKVK